jgi:hypothetical protein
MPVICAALMPATWSRRLTYAVRPAARAGELAMAPGNWTMVSIGAVGLPGKSLFSASATRRGAALAGSAVASTPPQTTFRNGAPRPSRTTTIGTAYRTGRRITLCASRYQTPLASVAGGRCTERRIRSEFTLGPSTASSAGSAVRAASMSTSTVATPP